MEAVPAAKVEKEVLVIEVVELLVGLVNGTVFIEFKLVVAIKFVAEESPEILVDAYVVLEEAKIDEICLEGDAVKVVDVGVSELVGVVEDVKSDENFGTVEAVEDTKLSGVVEVVARVSVVLNVDEVTGAFTPVLIRVI